MNRLQLITAFLLSLDLFAAEQLDSYAENIELVPSGKSEGNGIVLAWLEYDATVNIERFAQNADVLMAHLTIWLMNNDALDDDNTPRLDVELLDDNMVDVELTVHFKEALRLIPDPTGPFILDGQTWQLVEQVPVDIAETGNVERAAT